MNKLKVNVYRVLDDCIANGISAGWNKAHKHTDTPPEDEIKRQIHLYVMLEVSEYFEFDDDVEE